MRWRIGEFNPFNPSSPGKIMFALVGQGLQNRHEYGTKIQIQDGSLEGPVASDGRQN
jgi:hypothetical protein